MSTFPPLPPWDDELRLEGFSLGHGTDSKGMTGVTVILCPEGALAAAEVRGTASGTRQFDSLVVAHHVASRVHAVVLAGGSGFGLAAADPVVEWLAREGHGFRTGVRPVPLVPTAILFDLGFGDPEAVPGAELVREALGAAGRGRIDVGSVGAGTGATVGKLQGMELAMKGGFGFAAMTLPGGPTVAAAVAVNALGDVDDPESGRRVAGCRTRHGGLELARAERVLASLPPSAGHPWDGNTTLAVVLTDAELDKAGALKVSQMAFGGLHRTLVPALSPYDGDLVVTLARGGKPAEVSLVGLLAARTVARAIVRGVEAADGFGLLPAARDLLGG